MILKYIIKNVSIIIFINILFINNKLPNIFTNILVKYRHYSFHSDIKNITNIPEIYLDVSDLNYSVREEYDLIEARYYVKLFDNDFKTIKPSDLVPFYNINILCVLNLVETNENIYSLSNIYENEYYSCVEYIKIGEKTKLGIKIYKYNNTTEETESSELFFFTDKSFNFSFNKNNNNFNIMHIINNYNKLIMKIRRSREKNRLFEDKLYLKSSFIQPPLFSLKQDIAQVEGRWYFNNIYETYTCFCKGKICLDIKNLNMYIFQTCKYYFYLTIIDSCRYLYPKTHYLLSDFFDQDIEPSDSLPIFKEMLNLNMQVYYITVSLKVYTQFYNCSDRFKLIFGVRKINGNILEKFLELFLRLKVVVAAEKYESIDNLFYNIEYITYIFLGHGVTYIKSYLYDDYLSPKKYNKILLPKSELFISLALKAGWKNEDIVKIGYPRWDKYELFKKRNINYEKNIKDEKSIFLMFTWRKIKKGKNISPLYFDSLNKLFKNIRLNKCLEENNVILYFCYHHALKEKRIIYLNNTKIVKFIYQNEISELLKNSSLIITDFSSILFDAIVQRKPLILYIPDGLDPHLEDIYIQEYYETITKIKKGMLFLDEVFFDLKNVINKIIYYIKNGFTLEDEKLKFYKKFRLKTRGNTKKFIRYIKAL